MSAPAATLPDLAAPFAWRRAGDVVWLEASLGPATAAFSTRAGGRSEGPYRSLNLGILTADDRERVIENRLTLLGTLGRDADGIAMGRQVHGAEVEVREARPDAAAPLAEVDAQVVTQSSLTPLVLVADCVPLVLAAPGGAAAVHCGWRGIVAGIVGRALATVQGLTRGEVRAAIGPGIGPCCYAVGDEVREAFRARGHGSEVMTGDRLDLAGAVRGELERGGLEPAAIASSRLCTSCNRALFFSHRRDGGVTGRQAGLVWLSS